MTAKTNEARSRPLLRRAVIVSESNGMPTYHYWQDVSPMGLLEARQAILDLVAKPGSSAPLRHLDLLKSQSRKPLPGPEVMGALEGLVADRVLLVEDGLVIRLKF